MKTKKDIIAASGIQDINRNADIIRMANSNSKDINHNAEGEVEPLKNEVETGEDVTKAVSEGVDTVVEVKGTSFKDKFLARTDQGGLTQAGKLPKAFFWGFVGGIALDLLYRRLRKKGYLKFKFLKK